MSFLSDYRNKKPMMNNTGSSSVYAFQQVPVLSRFAHQNVDFSSCGHQSLPVFPVSNPVGVPLQTSCHFCKGQVIKNLSNSYFQVPVQIKLSVPLCENSFGSARVRNPLENELLQQPPPSHFLSYQQNSTREGRSKRKPSKACKKYACAGGPSKWFLKRRADQLSASLNSKNKMVRTQRVLKRLQNHHMRHTWKLEKRRNAEKQESIRQSKFKMLCQKGIKAPRQSECTLWNCPRKEFKRKRPFMPVDFTTRRSASRLSNLSRKSRSPILFRRSP